ncbi:hypothetical protein D1006_22245 [Burkholderia stabilis]|uniref:Uncharacterized protein n=1 Tax=Burkholderia stabilis TaxID=95485 RepID=A0A4Q2AEX8_9BURK|nr:hypothetical protein D1006_22245 [Burkholderia stabilis]
MQCVNLCDTFWHALARRHQSPNATGIEMKQEMANLPDANERYMPSKEDYQMNTSETHFALTRQKYINH